MGNELYHANIIHFHLIYYLSIILTQHLIFADLYTNVELLNLLMLYELLEDTKM